MTPTLRRIVGAGLLAAATAFAAGASAQSYPGNNNINFIVPFPPGGGTDVGARVVLDAVSQATGWTFVVQNQPGAGGTIGMDQLARAAELCGKMGDDGVRGRRIVAVAETARTSRRSDTPWKRLPSFSSFVRPIRSTIP